MKKFLYVLNTDEDGAIDGHTAEALNERVGGTPALMLCAKLEADIADLSPEEVVELGVSATGLDSLIRTGYETLSLITYFTTGPKETRAWTIKKGAKAPQAAGEIHTDFEKGFIRAETINWKDLIDAGGEVKAKEKGLMRLEGKEYVVEDGDVMVFRFA